MIDVICEHVVIHNQREETLIKLSAVNINMDDAPGIFSAWRHRTHHVLTVDQQAVLRNADWFSSI